MKQARAGRLNAMVLLGGAMLCASAPAFASSNDVYGFCTVRDISFESGTYSGKVYRTELFSVSRDYDSAISMTPMVGGKESATLERWVGRNHGFRPDRSGDPSESQHYCIEAPFTEEGQRELREVQQAWDNSSFSQVSLVRVPWIPMEATLVPDPKPAQDHARRVAETEAGHQAAKARAAAEVEAVDRRNRAAQAEYEQRRQAYREEYKRITGRYPD